MSKKDNYYYKKNQTKKNYYKKEKANNIEKKVTYDSLMHANTITEKEEKENYNTIMIMKYIAITIILFAIIIGSFILFRQM